MSGTDTPWDFVALARKRPGMFAGGTDAQALHQLVSFILDQVYSDAWKGACRDFVLEAGADGALTLCFTGHFVPPEELAEVVTGRRWRLGWVPDWGWNSNLPVALALSSHYEVETWSGARQWRLSGSEGRLSGEPREVPPPESVPAGGSGLRIRFLPDATIFESPTFDAEQLLRQCRELAFLLPGLGTRFTDPRTGESTRMFYAGGITERLVELTADMPRHHPEPLAFEVEWEGFRVRCALQWCEAEGRLWSHANLARTRLHGGHVEGVFQALLETLSALSGEGVRTFSRSLLKRGLWAIISADGDEARQTLAMSPPQQLSVEGLEQAVASRLQPLMVEALRGHPLTPWLVEHGRVRPRPAVVTKRRTPD